MKSEKTKKPYQKPLIEQVRLIAEEAVLVDCKTAALVNSSASKKACGPNPCASTVGS